MKLINPSYEIIEHQNQLSDILKHIELAGRTCYKSEDKITEGSAEKFVNQMITNKHFAMLEHGTIYLTIIIGSEIYDKNYTSKTNLISFFKTNKYSKINKGNKYNVADQINDTVIKNFIVNNGPATVYYITTNLRVIVEKFYNENPDGIFDIYNNDVLQYLSEPSEKHIKRITVHFTANIHFYKDITRHRVFSWAIESTRFCNYCKEKFGMSVNFIRPCWLKDEEEEEFIEDLKTIESIYFKWINKGWQAQQAATFLPQATKADIIMTGFATDFVHLFDLRALGTTGQPHPQVKELIYPLYEDFLKRKYFN